MKTMANFSNLAILIFQACTMVGMFPTNTAFVPQLGSGKVLSPLWLVRRRTAAVRYMSNVEQEDTKPKTDGNLYDDEVAPEKPSISDQMKARLAREAGSGLDPDKKQTNVLLYIMLAVAVLVVLGGKDIFF